MSRRSFLQSKDWADVQAAVGHPSVETGGRFLFEHALPVGRYLYCPHPDFADPAAFVAELRSVMVGRKAWFVRVEPNAGCPPIPPDQTVRPTTHTQPGNTLVVPLASDEQLFAGFKPKTRYNIRLAERHGVEIRVGTEPSELLAFLELIGQTAARARIRTHSERYYTTMVRMLGRTDQSSPDALHVEVGIARHQGVPVAAALIAYFQGGATYLHGGSDHTTRALMAPYLLHASLMRRARDLGARTYDLGGIAPAPQAQEHQTDNVEPRIQSDSFAVRSSQFAVDATHPWAGITRFKRGFGGEPVAYPPAVDVIRNRALYSAYTLARRLRRGTFLTP